MNHSEETKTALRIPLTIKILLAFISISGSLTMMCGFVYYRHAEKTVRSSIENQASVLQETIVQEFDTRYAQPIRLELELLAASLQLTNFLMSPKEEILLHRADVERLFVNLLRDCNIHKSTVFLDATGQEKVAVEGTRRKRSYRRLSDIPKNDITGKFMKQLFTELSEDQTKRVASTPPFLDNQGNPSFLAGAIKQEPEAGGFGGVIIQQCSLNGFFDRVSQKKVLNTPVVWIRDMNGLDLHCPPNDIQRTNPWPLIEQNNTPETAYIKTGACRVFPSDAPLITIACSIPNDLIAKNLKPVIWSVTAIFSGILIISVLSSLAISRWISKPIKKLTIAVSQVSGANLDIDLPQDLTDSRDEVGLLASSFKTMTMELQASTTSVETLNAANTQLMASQDELQTANNQLEANEKKLRDNMGRMQRFNQLAAKREIKMKELKQTINALLLELGRETYYKEDTELAEIYAAPHSTEE